jgi:YesN/AraC family two-component response regulator
VKEKKLLIVDDEWIIADSLSSMDEWGERRIQVVGTAGNGYEAIRMLEEQSIDLVITDIRMPDMDGLQLLQYVYEAMPQTNVILISGYEDFRYAQQALAYQAKGYVLKPIDTDELLEIVDRILSQWPAELANSPDQDLPRTYRESIIDNAKQFIQNNLNRPLALSDAASHVHLTPHYFGQLFKTECGILFNTYLTQVRMEKACELLQRTDMKIYQICELVGYIDSKYFAKVFQKTYGMTPNEYRQNQVGT